MVILPHPQFMEYDAYVEYSKDVAYMVFKHSESIMLSWDNE